MAKYLLTGAAGFIASRAAELLLDQGHEVLALDNLNDAYDVRLKQWRLDRLREKKGFSFEQVDIADRARLEAALPAGWHFEAVINLAARAGVRQSVEDPWVYLETNATGTLNLLELCRRREIGKFVLASTSSLYGAHNEVPFREDDDTSRPLSPYAASKKAAESMCFTYHHLYGLDVTVFRYFTVYGPAGRPDMSVFRFVQWVSEQRPVTIYGDGRQSRDFTYVDDIARGTVAGLKPLGYEVINLGSDGPAVLIDILRLVEELVGNKAQIDYQPAHPADVQATWANIDKARRLLSWQPQTTYREGIANVVAWYKANRDWASQIAT
jgi:nucleoside-diphosphate-sugar epimerase